MKRVVDSPPSAAGFSLVEVLLALALGLLFSGVMVQALFAEGSNSQRLARLLRERAGTERALQLIRSDLQRASQATAQLGGSSSACSLAGRSVVLHLETPEGPITYSVGKPAEPIWRGQVLMRCGMAFGLQGEPSRGQAQNRVLLDGLASAGVQVHLQGPGALRLELRQELPLPRGEVQVLHQQRVLPAPSPI